MATFNQIHRLEISWTTSKGRDTYGYNICRLDDSVSGKRYKTCGGGYDMIGTVLGDWFQDQYQHELYTLALNNKNKMETYSTSCPDWQKIPGLYGMTFQEGKGVLLDGACGVESMIHIIEACGFEIEKSYDKRKGHLRAFYVQKLAD